MLFASTKNEEYMIDTVDNTVENCDSDILFNLSIYGIAENIDSLDGTAKKEYREYCDKLIAKDKLLGKFDNDKYEITLDTYKNYYVLTGINILEEGDVTIEIPFYIRGTNHKNKLTVSNYRKNTSVLKLIRKVKFKGYNNDFNFIITCDTLDLSDFKYDSVYLRHCVINDRLILSEESKKLEYTFNGSTFGEIVFGNNELDCMNHTFYNCFIKTECLDLRKIKGLNKIDYLFDKSALDCEVIKMPYVKYVYRYAFESVTAKGIIDFNGLDFSDSKVVERAEKRNTVFYNSNLHCIDFRNMIIDYNIFGIINCDIRDLWVSEPRHIFKCTCLSANIVNLCFYNVKEKMDSDLGIHNDGLENCTITGHIHFIDCSVDGILSVLRYLVFGIHGSWSKGLDLDNSPDITDKINGVNIEDKEVYDKVIDKIENKYHYTSVRNYIKSFKYERGMK